VDRPRVKSAIDWESQGSVVLLNPHLPEQERHTLTELSQKFARAGHIWIASSGSSQKQGDSLKLIALSKNAFLCAAKAANEHVQATSKDVWVRSLPRFHVGGLSIELRASLSDARVVESSATWNPHEYMKIMHEQGGTLSALVPTQVHDLLENKLHPPPALRAIIIGGAALAPELYLRAREQGWPLLPSYGLTECCSQVATAELGSDDSRLRVLNHCEVRLDSEAGFLQIRSRSLLTGFAQKIGEDFIWQEPAQSGWYTTADHVEIEREGRASFLTPLGRHSDFVKINGEGVNLSKLRDLLTKTINTVLPSAHFELALLDLNHARKGAELVLVCSQKFQANAHIPQIHQNFNDQVSSIEKIQRVIFVDKIPRSALGKIQWDFLRRLSSMI
jgi:O-succinylbenzoic acid--CoA ligase